MRRYRVFIVFAVVFVGALYHFTSLTDLESAGAASVEGLKNFGQKVESSVPPTTSKSDAEDSSKPKDFNAPIAAPSLPDYGAAKQSEATAIIKKPDRSSKYNQAPATTGIADERAKPSTTTAQSSANDDRDAVKPNATPAEKPAPPMGSILTNKTSKPHTDPADAIADGGGGRLEIIADTSISKIHWSQVSEHFPVPTELLKKLPIGKPKVIPKIQYEFAAETSDEKAAREKKRDVIKQAFSFSWMGYKRKAWMQDELSPVSGKYRNPFCAWGATLVDSLDTLYMMGLKEEFEEAVDAVKEIDFTTSPRNDIPLFETVIRYLGGLVAAYDISDGAHRILLDKAVELADILMGAFDTPNRMPMIFYLWKPTFASQPHRAKTRVVLAELGSLSLEFTRLAQITKEDKYYDAIARITNEFEIWQNNTRMPGLWPLNVDASGCKKPAIASSPTTNLKGAIIKRETHDETALHPQQGTTPKPPECEAQGLASRPFTAIEQFGIGGEADSTYEYLPKEYMLLGGLEDQYRTLYLAAADTITKDLLYRAMIPDNKRRILHPGVAEITDTNKAGELKPEGSHLGCFAGGMYAVGSKIFDREGDMKIAKELTDGCVWAYEATTTGIMPEGFLLVPCPDPVECPWNETYYHEKLDPDVDIREKTRLAQIADQQVVLAAAEETKVATSPIETTPGPFSSALEKSESHPADHTADGAITLAQPTSEDNLLQSTDGLVDRPAPPAAEQSAEQGVSLPAGGANAGMTVSPPAGDAVLLKSRMKRQLGDIAPPAAAVPLDSAKDIPAAAPPAESINESTTAQTLGLNQGAAADKTTTGPPATTAQQNFKPSSKNAINDTLADAHILPQAFPYTPFTIPTHEEFVQARIRDERLPKGMTRVTVAKYILR